MAIDCTSPYCLDIMWYWIGVVCSHAIFVLTVHLEVAEERNRGERLYTKINQKSKMSYALGHR